MASLGVSLYAKKYQANRSSKMFEQNKTTVMQNYQEILTIRSESIVSNGVEADEYFSPRRLLLVGLMMRSDVLHLTDSL
uniref:Uncharacterized protein n=1 Tax=Parascaris equorum TaxID=6256 RepID=A0A914R8D5_PAREQ